MPVRLPSALKDEFEWAAEQDGVRGVSTWLRQLGEQRAEELRTEQAVAGMTMADATALQATRNGALAQQLEHKEHGPALVFVPGLGLDEKGD